MTKSRIVAHGNVGCRRIFSSDRLKILFLSDKFVMSKYVAKAALRQAKNYTKGYTDVQVKVREATSNDPWGPSGSQMQEVAEFTYSGADFMEIMDLIDKRLNDSGKNWRHVFKALTLLDYLIHCGSEQVVAYAKQNLYVIKTLKEFQYIDEEGRDQGSNVREKSKAISTLLADESRLKEARKKRQELRERIGSGAGNSSLSRRNSAGVSGGSGNYANSNSLGRNGDIAVPGSKYEEERQLERAIEESKRIAAEEERRRGGDSYERDIRHSLERQHSNAVGQSSTSVRGAAKTNNDIDLWGAVDAGNQKSNNDMDFFASLSQPAQQPQQAVVLQQSDPFMFQSNNYQQQQQQQQQVDPFGFSSNNAGFAQQQQPQITYQQRPQLTNSSFSTPSPFATTPAYNTAQSSVAASPFAVASPGNAYGGIPTGGFSMDSGFDNGAAQRNLVPKYVQSTLNPNAQLASIARNASQIDPFASLASTTNNNAFAPSSTPSSSAPNGQQQMRPQGSSSDPFAALSPFAGGSISRQASTFGAGGLQKQPSLAPGGGMSLNAMQQQRIGNASQQGFGNPMGSGTLQPQKSFTSPQQQQLPMQQQAFPGQNQNYMGQQQQQQVQQQQQPQNNDNFFF